MSLETTMTDDAPEVPSNASAESPVQYYRYRNAQLDILWTTSVPKDDEAALAYFHTVMRFGKEFKPVYIEKNIAGPESEEYVMLPWQFDPETYTTTRRK